MNKKFAKFDTKSVRTVILNIDEFNEFLKENNVGVEFIKRSVDLKEDYNIFKETYKNDEREFFKVSSIEEYDKKFYHCSCATNFKSDTIAEIALSDFLGVHILKYSWYCDEKGNYYDDLLKLTYKL